MEIVDGELLMEWYVIANVNKNYEYFLIKGCWVYVYNAYIY